MWTPYPTLLHFQHHNRESTLLFVTFVFLFGQSFSIQTKAPYFNHRGLEIMSSIMWHTLFKMANSTFDVRFYNIIVLGVAFMFIFTAFQTCSMAEVCETLYIIYELVFLDCQCAACHCQPNFGIVYLWNLKRPLISELVGGGSGYIICEVQT